MLDAIFYVPELVEAVLTRLRLPRFFVAVITAFLCALFWMAPWAFFWGFIFLDPLWIVNFWGRFWLGVTFVFFLFPAFDR